MSAIFDTKIKSFLFNNFKNTSNIEKDVTKNINNGNTLYNNLISKYGNVANMSDSDVEKITKTLNQIKATKNKISNIVNNTITQLNNINNIIQIISNIIISARVIIKILTALPIPAQFLTSGVIIKLSNIVQKADRKIEFLDTIVKGTLPFIAKLLEILTKIQNLLLQLDQIIALIEAFLAQRNAKFAQDIADSAKNDVKTQQIALNIEENSNVIGFYNGFRFELREENDPQYQIGLIKRKYAVAINSKNIEIIKSQPSFASNPEILISELKFIIDRDNLKS